MDTIKRGPRDLWTQALRSDEYTQARGTFVSITWTSEDGSITLDNPVTKHCCLAVATDVAIKKGGIRTVRPMTREPVTSKPEEKRVQWLTGYEKLQIWDWELGQWVQETNNDAVDELEHWTAWDERPAYGGDPDEAGVSRKQTVYRWVEEEEVLPVAVMKWLGFTDGNPVLAMASDVDGGPLVEREAISLNDGLQWTYAQIADAIDQMPVED